MTGPAREDGPTLLTLSADRLTRRLLFGLIGFEILLLFLDATVNHAGWVPIGAIRRLFNLTREDGLGNWFASTQTLAVAAVMALIFLRARLADPAKARGWALLSLFFAYLAVDDGAKIHERLGTAAKSLPFIESFPGYAWHLLFGPFLAAMAVFILVFTVRVLNEPVHRRWLFTGLGLYAVAVVLDFAEGMWDGSWPAAWAAFAHPEDVRHFAKVFEEFLEMAGSTFFLVCVVGHFAKISPVTTVRLE